MLIHQNETVLVILTLIIYFAEALLAATLHPEGEIPTPPLPRFITHVAMSVAGLTANLTLMKQFAKLLQPMDHLSRFFQGLVVLMTLIMSVGIPIFNCTIIASAMGEELKFFLFLQDYCNFFINESEFRLMVIKYGGNPDTYMSWSAMPYMLKSTVGLTLTHVMVGLLMSLVNMSDQDRRKKAFKNPYEVEEKKNSKSEEDKRQERKERKDVPPMPAESRMEEQVTSNLKYLLRRLRYKDNDDEMQDILDKASEVMYVKITDNGLRIKFATRIHTLKTECMDLDKKKDSMDETKKQEANKRLKEKIRKLFSGSPNATKSEELGLGITLKGGPGN